MDCRDQGFKENEALENYFIQSSIQNPTVTQAASIFTVTLTVAAGEGIPRLVPVEDGGGGAKGESV